MTAGFVLAALWLAFCVYLARSRDGGLSFFILANAVLIGWGVIGLVVQLLKRA